MPKTRLLFVASEVYPFAKSGGLADVAHSLPRALGSGYEVSVILPLYRFIDRKKFAIARIGEAFALSMGGVEYPVEFYGCQFEGLDYLFVYSPLLCDRDFLYGPPERGYEDNAIRFGIFNYAVVALLKRHAYAIAHLNDWQSALAALLIKEDETILTKTLYTIHNLAYQGTFEKSVLKDLGINEKYFTMEGIEFYSQVSFMKAGIAYADKITTVSPTYAKEILTPKFGCGLEGFLKHHRSKLSGIINGIDTEHFSPSQDKALVLPYSDISAKAVNKKAYLKEAGLKGIDKPLFIFVGRFTWQKGMDLLIGVLDTIASLQCNIAILGEGEAKYYDAIKKIMDKHKNIHLSFGYEEALSHRMYAAGDFLLMPSLFEPCGLNQMIAMAYGTMPLVHQVGGLADTVKSYKGYDAKSDNGYGVVFSQATERAFSMAVKQALELYGDTRQYNRIVKHNMQCDFSSQGSARSYMALYETIIQ